MGCSGPDQAELIQDPLVKLFLDWLELDQAESAFCYVVHRFYLIECGINDSCIFLRVFRFLFQITIMVVIKML